MAAFLNSWIVSFIMGICVIIFFIIFVIVYLWTSKVEGDNIALVSYKNSYPISKTSLSLYQPVGGLKTADNKFNNLVPQQVIQDGDKDNLIIPSVPYNPQIDKHFNMIRNLASCGFGYSNTLISKGYWNYKYQGTDRSKSQIFYSTHCIAMHKTLKKLIPNGNGVK